MASEQEVEAAAAIISEARDANGSLVIDRASARSLAQKALEAAERVRAREQQRPAYRITEARGQS